MTSGGDFDYKSFRKEWDNLCGNQQYKEAEKLCHEGLAKSPQDQARGRLYNHLGFLYENFLDDKTFDDILEHYVLSLQVDESNANSHYNLANFLLEQGMQHLLRALELNPNHNKAVQRYANLTPIKANTTLTLDRTKYQVIEVIPDNGVRATRLIKRDDGTWERSNDEAVQIGISSPEKVSSSHTKTGGRTSNIGSNVSSIGGGRAPFSIDDSHKYDDDNDGRNSNEANGCCYLCVLRWYFWAFLWLIAIGGIAMSVLIYFNLFGNTQCTQNYSASEMAINSEIKNQRKLNILFVVDCGSSDWDKQFIATNTLLTNIISTDLSVRYDIMQYCNDGFVGNFSSILNVDFVEYTTQSPTISAANSGINQSAAIDGDNIFIAGAFEACQETFNTADADDSTPFLCIPFVSSDFADTFDAISVTADPNFSDIYLAFMVDEDDVSFTPNAYSVLGSFGASTECISRIDDDNAYGNSWWQSKFNCNSNTEEHAQCSHCINYAQSDELTCATEELKQIFSGIGVTEMILTKEEEECVNEYEDFMLYCLGGIVPLLLWVFVSVCVLCCRKCKNSNRRNMERAINDDDRKRALV